MLPLFKLVIDKDAEGMDYMGLVDVPAHGKNWKAFNAQHPIQKVEFKQHFNEEKRIVTGVAIATKLQIYRRREDNSEYNVMFTAKDTLEIAQELFKNGYMHNVNEMHDMNKTIKDIFLFESYFINDALSNIPESFADQNLQAGTWMTSYRVDDDTVWEKIKSGEFAGFSIEGWFKEIEVNVKKTKNQKSKKMKKSLMELLGFKKEAQKKESIKFDKEKHGEAVAVDGTVVMWEGDAPVEGGSLFVANEENEGEMILASDGEYSFEIEGVLMVATVDEAGVIVTLAEADAGDDEETLEAMRAMKLDYEAKLVAMQEKSDAQLKVIATEFDSMKKEFEKVLDPEGKGDKDRHNSGEHKPAWKRKNK